MRDGSLLAQDLAAGQLLPGPKGDKGETGDRGPQGVAGPGAVKLVLDRPGDTGAANFTSFAAVGPWEFTNRCLVAGGDIEFGVRFKGGSAGEFQMAGVKTVDDATFTQLATGDALDPGDEGFLMNGGVPPGQFWRFAETIQIKSGETVWTVTLNILADNRTSPRCFGYGTGVPAS